MKTFKIAEAEVADLLNIAYSSKVLKEAATNFNTNYPSGCYGQLNSKPDDRPSFLKISHKFSNLQFMDNSLYADVEILNQNQAIAYKAKELKELIEKDLIMFSISGIIKTYEKLITSTDQTVYYVNSGLKIESINANIK